MTIGVCGDDDSMKYECKITVLDTKCFEEYQQEYLANPKSGPCPFFKKAGKEYPSECRKTREDVDIKISYAINEWKK